VWAIRRESTKNIVVAPKPETKTPAAPAAKAELTPKAAPPEMPAPVAKPDITPEPTPVVAASAAPAAELTPLVDGTALVRQRVTDWADAWSRKDVAVYLGFYADKFAPAGSMPLPEWRRLREQRLSASADVRVEVSNLTAGLTNGVAETRFDQSYQSASYRETSRKTLEWIEQDGVWKIQRETVRNVVAERVLPVRTATARERLPAQEAPPPEKPVSSVTEKDHIHKRIMAWADTWARNDFSAYHDFYREGFVQEGGASWADWRRRRGSEGADVANVIAPRIEIEDLTLNVDGDRAVARFEQVWGSGAEVRERFQKVLEWEKREGRWLIHREAATPVAGVKMETKEALK
jgi:ketosteroid isomerase-like protein